MFVLFFLMPQAQTISSSLLLSTSYRKYWHHWTSVANAGWAHRHPGKGCFPISVYGDEAKYNLTYGDKFIALCLGSPLIRKQGILPSKSQTVFGLGVFKLLSPNSFAKIIPLILKVNIRPPG